MDELVERLSKEGQKVVVGGPAPSLEEFQRRLTEMGYVFVKFPDSGGPRTSGYGSTRRSPTSAAPTSRRAPAVCTWKGH